MKPRARSSTSRQQAAARRLRTGKSQGCGRARDRKEPGGRLTELGSLPAAGLRTGCVLSSSVVFCFGQGVSRYVEPTHDTMKGRFWTSCHSLVEVSGPARVPLDVDDADNRDDTRSAWPLRSSVAAWRAELGSSGGARESTLDFTNFSPTGSTIPDQDNLEDPRLQGISKRGETSLDRLDLRGRKTRDDRMGLGRRTVHSQVPPKPYQSRAVVEE